MPQIYSSAWLLSSPTAYWGGLLLSLVVFLCWTGWSQSDPLRGRELIIAVAVTHSGHSNSLLRSPTHLHTYYHPINDPGHWSNPTLILYLLLSINKELLLPSSAQTKVTTTMCSKEDLENFISKFVNEYLAVPIEERLPPFRLVEDTVTPEELPGHCCEWTAQYLYGQ